MCIFCFLFCLNYLWVIYMGIAYHKKTNRSFVQYTVRIEEGILDKLKHIAKQEGISINEVFNQSLHFAITDYEKQEKK